MTATFTATATFAFYESSTTGSSRTVTFTGSMAACQAKVAQWGMAGVAGTVAPTDSTRQAIQTAGRQMADRFEASEMARLAATPAGVRFHRTYTGGPLPR